MELLTPWSLAALALAVPLAAMYLRRRKRERVEVSSLALWRRVQADLQQRAGLRRFRAERALWLQLVALALLALALGGPTRSARVEPPRRLVMVVDTTASMQARDGAVTRLDRAKDAALRALAALPEGAEVTVIEGGCVPSIAVATTRERAGLRRGVTSLRARDCGGDLSRALALAADRLRGGGGARRVLVLTDGATRADALTVATPAPVEVVRVGSPAANVGVVTADLRPDARGESSPGARRFSLFGALGGAPLDAPRAVTVRAALVRDGGETSVALREARVGNGRSTLTIPVELRAEESAPLLRVSLEGAGDALAVDDLAYAPVPPSGRLAVRLVTRAGGSPWVSRALRADATVTLDAMDLARWSALRGRAFDGLTVFHGTAPEARLAGESLVFLTGPEEGASDPARVAGFALDPWAPRPRWTDVSPIDDRVRFVGTADVHLAAARPVRLGADERALVTADRGVMIAAHDGPRGSTTLAAFDPDRGDWPLRPGFVLFLRDAVEHARRRRAALALDARRAGALVTIPAEGAERVRVRGPETDQWLPVRDGRAEWPFASRAGVYSVERGRGAERVGLSLLDPVESALGVSELPWRGAVTRGAGGAVFERRPLSWALALAALAALGVEWWLFAGLRLRGGERP
ncbi:MAG: VWA domain-containing protein [Polyangiales bacterium]